jgi:glycosyltransferase involved in cell wall biosynthesis
VILSVVIITHNEEANLGRALASVQPLVGDGRGEIIVVDSGSTDRTVEIAKSYGAKVFIEEWRGYAAQKNSGIEKAEGDWILSLDGDEEVGDVARELILWFFESDFRRLDGGILLGRRNHFLGRWIRHGGFYPDDKLRLFSRGSGHFENRLVHEDIRLSPGKSVTDLRLHWSYGGDSRADLIHHSYPTLSDYLDHMNRYSSLGAEMVVAQGPVRFSMFNIVIRPAATLVYNYFFRLGFLDGREGLLLHLYHAVYVSWKYAKAWELSQRVPTKGERPR